MEPNNSANSDQVAFASLNIEIDIELILSVYALGGRRNPSRAHVPIGRVAVVTLDQEAFDHDGFPEVYLAGETIARSRFRKDAECLVAELREYPGTVSANATQRLAGISLTDLDLASVKFLFHLRLEDPIKLLSREAEWMTPEGGEHLNRTVEDLTRDALKSALADNVRQLWSHRDIREVSGSIFSRLDRTLRAWGLRLDGEVPAYRAYPQLLYEVALEFTASEKDLLGAEGAEKSALLEKLELQRADLLEMQNVSAQIGQGAGLFSVVKDRRKQIDRFADWLASEPQSALAAAIFLKKIYSPNYTAQEVELTEQVVLSAFRSPVLGLGERSGTEHGVVDTSQFGQLEAHFKAAFEVTD